MFKTLTRWIAAIALAMPLAANADILQFDVSLSGANEIPANGSFASGFALISYDTVANTYDFFLAATSLSSAVTGAHIHALADATQTAPAIVNLLVSPFSKSVSVSKLFVNGIGVAAPGTISAGNSHPSQSFLAALQSGLAYINVHTVNNPGGEIRGQLVAIVPELESYAMLLAGLGLLGFIVRRRSRRL